MIILDTNVVLAAQRSDHPHHSVARPWFDELLAGEEQFSVPNTVWASFLRLTTNHRIFLMPTPLADAFEFIRAVVVRPNHVVAEPRGRHLELLEGVCISSEAQGDLVPDAVLATLAREHGAELASFDRDFARFENLRWTLPRIGVD